MHWKVFPGEQADFQFWSGKMLLSVLLCLSPFLVTCVNLAWGAGCCLWLDWIHAPARRSLMAGGSLQLVMWIWNPFGAVSSGKMAATWPQGVFITVVGTGLRGCDFSSIIALGVLDTQFKLDPRKVNSVYQMHVFEVISACFLHASLESHIHFCPNKLILLILIIHNNYA